MLRSYRRESGEKASFTAWVLKCICQTVQEFPAAHALRRGRDRLIMFDEVDVSLAVEKIVDGVAVPIPLVLRDVGNLSLSEVTGRIEQAKKQEIQDSGDYVLEQDRQKLPVGLFAILPQWLRLWIWKILLSNPWRVKAMMGTVMVTSIGMMGKIPGWFLGYSIHPLSLALGSIVTRPGTKKQAGDREFQEITLLFDHDVIDGAPMARFTTRLVELLEKGWGLK